MNLRVLVHHSVAMRLDTASAFCGDQAEQGGILLGAYRDRNVEVTDLTEAAPTDERHLTRFVRQDPRHQEGATHAWNASGGTITMVGEWHTHPRGEPRPSSTDFGTWRGALRGSYNPMVFVIVAPPRWTVYLGTRRFLMFRFANLGLIHEGMVGRVLA